jgi:hypothetical protein
MKLHPYSLAMLLVPASRERFNFAQTTNHMESGGFCIKKKVSSRNEVISVNVHVLEVLNLLYEWRCCRSVACKDEVLLQAPIFTNVSVCVEFTLVCAAGV